MRKDLELKAQAEAEDSALITIEEVEEEPEEQKGGVVAAPTKTCLRTFACFFFWGGASTDEDGKNIGIFFALSTFFQVHRPFYEFFFHK